MTASPYPEIKMLIDGRWCSGPGQAVVNPALDSVIGTVPHVTQPELEEE